MGPFMQLDPKVPALQKVLKNVSRERQRFIYQVLVFVLTFITYTSYHVNKRPFSVVKGVLSPNCNDTVVNNSCHAWQPFSGGSEDKTLFGLLDFTFMIVYSISLLGSGYLAENTNLRIFLSSGMILTALSSTLFGLGYYMSIHTITFFFIMQTLAGITQSTGLPAVTEAVGMWIPHGKTGLIFGIWSFHQFLGNMIGNGVSGALITYGWGAPFLFSALLIAFNSGIIYTMLVPNPADVDITIDESSEQLAKDESLNSMTSLFKENGSDKEEKKMVGISLLGAFRIPGVLEYALCTFFVKLVLYTFFFWLPYIIKTLSDTSTSTAAYLTVIYDLGCGIGSVFGGIIYDCTDKPALINVIMLIFSAPSIAILFQSGDNDTVFSIFIFFSGCLIGGPFTLLTSSIAKRLSNQHFETAPNTKAIAVLTAIFDGFGSLGASIGPLITGVIETFYTTWIHVSTFLIICVLMAAVTLSRQTYREILVILSNYKKRKTSLYNEPRSEETDKLMEYSD